MPEFTCNICGAACRVECLESEPASCACGSNVRIRALAHLLSLELFGHSLSVADMPVLRSLRGMGVSDKPCLGEPLAAKFSYANTFMDRDPRVDICAPPAEMAGVCDFVLAADVLEHVAPPLEAALCGIYTLLQPRGFLVGSAPCAPLALEHYPELGQHRITPVGGQFVLVNRRRDGTWEVREDLVFHGDFGDTLEMRVLSPEALQQGLLAAGFESVRWFASNVPELGIIFDDDAPYIFVAAKRPFALEGAARTELVARWRDAHHELWQEQVRVSEAEEQLRKAREQARAASAQWDLAERSRWFRLGRALGLGPHAS